MEFTRTMELKFTKNDYQTKIGCCSRGLRAVITTKEIHFC